MIVTAIGSRQTPSGNLRQIAQIGNHLKLRGDIGRSGHAPGADYAWEQGFRENCEIYLPWQGFGKEMPCLSEIVIIPEGDILYHSLLLASVIHPAWDKCASPKYAWSKYNPVDPIKRLHARDINQVWGSDLQSPSDMLICWADVDPRFGIKGGTRTAWVCAKAAGIPCYNLSVPEDIQALSEKIEMELKYINDPDNLVVQ